MKIQYALVEPRMVTREGNFSVLAGLVQTEDEIKDYTVSPFFCTPENNKIAVIGLHNTHENLLERTEYPVDVREDSFHRLLTKDIWRGVETDYISGEVSFVKTDFPETPDGTHTYVIFGIMKGKMEDLELVSRRVFISEGSKSKLGDWTTYRVTDNGVQATHEIGNHLLNILNQPIWGFGPRKYGMTSDINMSLFKRMAENNLYVAEHGENLPGFVGIKPDEEYRRFLVGMKEKGMIPAPQWLDEASQLDREQAAKQVMIELMQENSRSQSSDFSPSM